jgi:hypothetical protein
MVSHERAANYAAIEMFAPSGRLACTSHLRRGAKIDVVPTVEPGSICEFDGNEIVTAVPSQQEAVGRTSHQCTLWPL